MINYKIHFIRHGMCEDSEKGIYTGRQDPDLSKKGMEQLANLKEQFIYPDVDMIYSSPLKRCVQTANILYPDNYTLIDDNLTELGMGIFEGKSIKQLEDNSHFKCWLEKGLAYTIPNGENGEEFSKRCIFAFKNIFDNMTKQKTKSVGVITHSGVILYLLSAMGVPKLDPKEYLTQYGEGFTICLSLDMWMRSRAFEIFSKIPYEPSIQDDYNFEDDVFFDNFDQDNNKEIF